MALRALVTDAHELAGLSAVRSLGRAGVRVVAASPAHLGRPPAARSRHCSAWIGCPDPWHDHLHYREWLAAVQDRDRFDAVLPVTEASVVAAAAARSAGRIGRWLIPGDEVLRITLSKRETTRKAGGGCIPLPATVEVDDRTTAAALVAALGVPLVVKTDNLLDCHGRYLKGQTLLAADAAAAESLLARARRRGGLAVAQAWVPGCGEAAFVLRWGGEVVQRFGHRRIHEVPWSGGASSLRESRRDEDALELGDRVAGLIGLDGVAMIELRRDPGTGRLVLIEINGRLWGSLALALHAGVDFPWALLRCHLGDRPAAVDWPVGLRCRNLYPGELRHVVSVISRERGAVGPSRLSAVAGLVGACLDPLTRHDHLWPGDPGPALVQARRAAREAPALLAEAFARLTRGRRSSRRARLVQALVARQAGGTAALLAGARGLVFVCHGNLCRSAFAAAYWEQRVRAGRPWLPVSISRGLAADEGRPAPRWMLEAAAICGVDLTPHRSRRLHRRDLAGARPFLVMDGENALEAWRRFRAVRPRLLLLGPLAAGGPEEIGDPLPADGPDPRAATQAIAASLDALAGLLQTGPRPPSGRGAA